VLRLNVPQVCPLLLLAFKHLPAGLKNFRLLAFV
jgi:hypothetical protein